MRDIRVRNFPTGYGFRPTDKELVRYLQMKIQGFNSKVDEVIAEIDICEFEPWNLPDKAKIKSDDQEWFFISPPVKKYPNSKRINRATNFGHWKVTGKVRNITDQTTKTVIGKKTSLVFYKGRCSSKKSTCSKKTDWVLHEYRLIELLPNQKELALYLLRNKCEDCEPRSDVSTDFEDQAMDDATPNNDTPKCDESEQTNYIPTDFGDQAEQYTTHKTDTPKCVDYGPSSNVTTDFEYQAQFEHDMNAETLTQQEAIFESLQPLLPEGFAGEEENALAAPFSKHQFSAGVIQPEFLENETNALAASSYYSNLFNEPQFSVEAIQQEQDTAMIGTPFFYNQGEYCYDETTYTCFNPYTPQ